MSTHETIADIVREMRGRDGIEVGGVLHIHSKSILALADRIEAAAERERKETKEYFEKLHDGPSMVCTAKDCQVRNALGAEAHPSGNAAALREALAELKSTVCEYITDCLVQLDARLDAACAKARAALAAPARNCDRFATANDAVKGYIAAHPHDDEPDASTYGSWLFAPAEEEVRK